MPIVVVVGVTGNIGSGKSTVCQILAKLGAGVIDADALGHEVYRPHSQAWEEIVATFGGEVLSANEEIDRQKLGEIVFSDPAAREKLNQITHPKIYDLARERIEMCQRQGIKVVVLEAALLIEASWTKVVDKVWLVVTSEGAVVDRVTRQRNMDESQILGRLKSQMPIEEKIKYADEIIYNDGDVSQLEAKVSQLWRQLNVS